MTRKQREAELRDAAARSLLEYEADKQARRVRLGIEPCPEADLLAISAWIREALTVAEKTAKDACDLELLRGVTAQINATVALGDLLARRRRTYREGTNA